MDKKPFKHSLSNRAGSASQRNLAPLRAPFRLRNSVQERRKNIFEQPEPNGDEKLCKCGKPESECPCSGKIENCDCMEKK